MYRYTVRHRSCHYVMHPQPARSVPMFKCRNTGNCTHKPKPAEDVVICPRCRDGVCRICINRGVPGGGGLRANGEISVTTKWNAKKV